jgi:hypothetical protein
MNEFLYQDEGMEHELAAFYGRRPSRGGPLGAQDVVLLCSVTVCGYCLLLLLHCRL